MYRLQCPVQTYAWGKVGMTSTVAQLKGGEVSDTTPYAEYWFGTHPSGPAFIEVEGKQQKLQEFLKEHSDALGPVLEHYGSDELPFLSKVLSVAKALSIQAHPNRALAQQLHKAAPEVYKDGNHKPEMAIALTTFRGMCGFRQPSAIAQHLQCIPEFKELAGEEGEAFVKAAEAGEVAPAALKAFFQAYMNAPKERVEDCVQRFTKRLAGDGEYKEVDPDVTATCARLSKEFPGDIGVFGPLLFNVVTLQPGQAMFLAANEPHAYLDGDCFECMACSDNVVRAGLTPKFKDVDTLVNMLTYKCGSPAIMEGAAQGDEGILREYVPPIPEFRVQVMSLQKKDAGYAPPAVPSASTLLVYKGAATITAEWKGKTSVLEVSRGDVLFQPYGCHITIAPEDEFVVYRTVTNA